MNEEQKQELINFAVDVKRLAKALAKLMPQFEEYAYDLQQRQRDLIKVFGKEPTIPTT
jgi:hypothetical protein